MKLGRYPYTIDWLYAQAEEAKPGENHDVAVTSTLQHIQHWQALEEHLATLARKGSIRRVSEDVAA